MNKLVQIISAVSVVICAAISAQAAEKAAERHLVAKYKNIEVTKEDVERYIEFRVPRDKRNEYLSSEQQMLKVIENIIVIRSLSSLAENPDEDQLRWQSEFQRQSWLSDLAQSQHVSKALAGADWDALAKEAYIAEPNRYTTRAQVEAAHILINTRQRSRDEAFELVNSLRKRILAGEDFNELAIKYSDDPSAEQNRGELGAFVAGRMVKPFADAAFAMKEPGSISEPVETEYGFHLIKLHKSIPAGRRSFDEVKNLIIRDLANSIADKAREALLVDTRSLHGVDLKKEVVEQIVSEQKTNMEK